jgi:hypothetical protein
MTATEAQPFVIAPALPARLSMSFLRSSEGCLRRAHLDREARVPSDGDALIGTLFHEAAATIGFTAVMRGSELIDVDEAVDIARRVMRRRTGPLPRATHGTVLELIERWTRRPGCLFYAGELFEVLSVQPLAGRLLSARLDRVRREDATVYVTDLKSGYADVGTKLTMQGEVYAWHVFEREPDIDLVIYAEDHVRFGVPNGPYEITRDDVYGPGGIEEFLLDSLARLNTAYEAGGELPATPGSACSSPSACPHAASCSVPEEYRPDTLIDTSEDATELLGVMLVLEARRDALAKQARGYLTRSGARAVQLNGEEYGFATRPGSRLDKKALAADLQAGVPVEDLEAYAVPTNPTCGRRKAL